MTEQAQHANGVNTCVSCGSSAVSFDGGALVCGYCRHRWNTAVIADELRLSEGIDKLVGTSALKGAHGSDASSVVTVECSGCGAALSLNSDATLTATCPWCRHTLSLNTPIANGAVPDAILPFYVTREDAAARMAAFVSTRTTYASDTFKRDFATDALHAIYLPYLVVDGNVTVRLDGTGWSTRGVSGGNDNPAASVITTEVHTVMREVDLLVDDAAIEARTSRSRLAAAVSTSNIINAIQPFDVANAVRFDARYLAAGTAFERRDVEVSGAIGEAANLFTTIARGYVNQTLTEFTGGVRWEHEQTWIKGTRWISVLLPVWLYAFAEETATGPMMHYIAVNGRSGEIEGSVPTDDAAVAKNAKKWGRTAGWIAGAVFAAPSLAWVPSLVFGLLNVGVLAFVLAVGAIMAGGTAVFAFAAAKFTFHARMSTLHSRHRNPDARLKPEVEVTYTPTRLAKGDARLGTFDHSGGPQIPDRNDHEPHTRAADARVSYSEPPVDPREGTDPAAAFERETAGRGRLSIGSIAGSLPTAPPPSGVDTSGGRIDLPFLKKSWAIGRDGKLRRI